MVEQTGYPPEVVRLDADLEADLGIDSIKKAQLFGELREQFELRPTGQIKLADFTTLRRISEFLEASSSPPNVEQSAIEVVARLAPEQAAAPGAPATVLPDRLGAQLVEFVVEQTGYPPEVVRFEADLEADLGIDSIKKAQLFGELREQYALTPRPGLKLGDFPTLGHILAYLKSQLAERNALTASAEFTSPKPGADQGAANGIANGAMNGNANRAVHRAPPSPVVHVPPRVNQALSEELRPLMGKRVLELSGSPYEMGRQHGIAMSGDMRRLFRRIVEASSPWRPGFELPNLETAAHYLGPAEIEELQGIADGARVDLANVLAHNLSLAPDYAAGCTQFAISAAENHGELLHGVNEDAPLALRAPLALTRVVQSRRPRGAMAYVTFSIAGQFGGFNGMNSSGLAVSSTLLLDRPAPELPAVGLVHAAVVKSVLESATDIESAISLVRGCRRLGAWSMCLSHHANDRICYLEYDRDQVWVNDNARRVFSTNHSLLGQRTTTPPEHSAHRLARLEALLGSTPVTLEAARSALRDRHDGGRGRVTPHATMNTVCRVDNQVSIVMRPAAGEIWATAGASAGGAADHFFLAPFPGEMQTAAPSPANISPILEGVPNAPPSPATPNPRAEASGAASLAIASRVYPAHGRQTARPAS